MSAKTGGSLATVFMSIPLAAIPLMAIFGIPQFTEVVASPDDPRRDVLIEPELGEPRIDSYRERASDLFDDAPRYAPRESSVSSPAANPFDDPDPDAGAAAVEWPADQQVAHHNETAADGMQPPLETGQGSAALPGHSITGDRMVPDPMELASGPTSQMTWRRATHRLQELGIEDYHLERGESFDSFLFVCAFEPVGTTNVLMRFEAEADEPLAAVTDVLDQIDRWLRRSFAESRQAALISGGGAP